MQRMATRQAGSGRTDSRRAGAKLDCPLAPLQRSAWLFPIGLAVVVAAVALLLPTRDALPAPAWLVTPFVVLMLLAILLLPLQRRRIAIEGRELVIAATFYTRRLPVDALDLDHARIMSLAERTEYKPMLKTNGFALPSFQAGHFRMRNFGKAFCLLTDQTRILALPQRAGTMLLLSPQNPQALLDALRSC